MTRRRGHVPWPILLVLVACITSSFVGAHPSLISCVCGTMHATTAVVSTSSSKGQAAKYALPSCVADVFAQTGIRWYINGPVQPGIKYWTRTPVEYTSGRAAKRLISLGYRCSRTQLYDPTEVDT
uniref:Ig-like domain-containing protein n=1 Tax=Globisporangium ultimum (strain ATCC 200006 / CBS 805.95 / DAOM BR144) TaxID=431595 RepID=K3WQ19_GLOUD